MSESPDPHIGDPRADRSRSRGHTHGHLHGSGDDALALHRRVAAMLWPAVAACGMVTLVALLLLWPRDGDGFTDPLLLDADPIAAEVVSVDDVPCSSDGTQRCRSVAFEMDGGPYAGDTGMIELGPDHPLSAGDGILVTAFETQSGDVVYSFYEFQRDTPMTWLLVLFVAAVLLLGRWRGVGALAGLAFSLVVIVQFTLPALLDGSDAVAVALTTASLIAFAALFLAHGFTAATAVALLSTFASLLLTAGLAAAFVSTANLTGLTDDSSLLLGGLATGIDARGILLAGIVIGSLGVLDDVTVTQVSAVWELKRLQPSATVRQLVTPALRIGRDHISSTVNTLFLAYAGAALPLLLLFTEAGQGVGSVVTREIVATEVVRALVGSIGLVASVPIATWLAAIVLERPAGAARVPARRSTGLTQEV